MIGLGLGELDRSQVDEIIAVHPRGDFKNDFLQTYVDGLKHRPKTTNGTVNADVLEQGAVRCWSPAFDIMSAWIIRVNSGALQASWVSRTTRSAGSAGTCGCRSG
ncbi:hypothetical protein [Streptomyces nigra]|uniref:hypothetical protein n=1 Tax=Streptomyces nigra TaxID=1827580 RepID=UPI003819883A